MIRECHELTAVLVHVMLDRARVFKSSELLDEKMASLGRLAAGLAHELNNPASAVARSAKTLVSQLGALDDATQRFAALEPVGRPDARRLPGCATSACRRQPASAPMELADRQDAIDDWLTAHDLEGVDAEPLARLRRSSPPTSRPSAPRSGQATLAIVLRARGHASGGPAAGVGDRHRRDAHPLAGRRGQGVHLREPAGDAAAARDRAGAADTITVLRSKARRSRSKSMCASPEQLPTVEGYGGELNQVWANLVDNAIDATPGGRVRVEAGAADDTVVVRVIDDGPGIPPDVAGRIFDPFFTTKEIGAGHRSRPRHRPPHRPAASRRHRREHRPGGTEFRVTLPASAAAS